MLQEAETRRLLQSKGGKITLPGLTDDGKTFQGTQRRLYNLLKTRKSLIYWTENKHKTSHPAKIYSGRVQMHLQILVVSLLSPSKTIKTNKELIFCLYCNRSAFEIFLISL